MSAPAKRLSNDGLVTVVRVNGIEIPDAEINIESGNFEGGTIEERQYQATVSLVIRELLRQRADELELANEDELERLDEVVAHDVHVPAATTEACREYYDKNQSRFASEPLIEARHILLAAAPDDFEERDRQRTVAETLIERLQQNRDAFPRLARKHSSCPSSEQGGNLGQLSRGQTVPEFDSKALSLPEGLAERPIETRYGWHVVEIVRRVDGEQLPFAAVQERIASYLAERSQRRAFSQYVRLLIAEAEIEGVDLARAESPLVQ